MAIMAVYHTSEPETTHAPSQKDCIALPLSANLVPEMVVGGNVWHILACFACRASVWPPPLLSMRHVSWQTRPLALQ
jgi:hypothetical protein